MEGKLRAVGRGGRTAALALAVVALGGCQEGGLASYLRSSGVGEPPNEFLVLPTKPLEMPQNLAALPPPTPGRANLVDPHPETDAVAALTGRPSAPGSAGAGALIARAGAADPAIRGRLAAEDVVWRQENQGLLLERLANRDNPDWQVYEGLRLDADAEFERLRARGLQVPAAPPPY